MGTKKDIIHLRWQKRWAGIIPAYAKSYFQKYGHQRSMCWLAPSDKKIMTDKISKVTCKRCLATIKKQGLK